MFDLILRIAPFVLFGVPLLVIFGIFISGAFTLFFTRESDRGKDIIARALTYFLILLTLFLVFAGVSYLVRRGGFFDPGGDQPDFPGYPMGVLPPAPNFAAAGRFSFYNPKPLSEIDIIELERLFGIFCKTEQGYDIIDIATLPAKSSILSSGNYECWEEQCAGPENIYAGYYWVDPEGHNSSMMVVGEMKRELELICATTL